MSAGPSKWAVEQADALLDGAPYENYRLEVAARFDAAIERGRQLERGAIHARLDELEDEARDNHNHLGADAFGHARIVVEARGPVLKEDE